MNGIITIIAVIFILFFPGFIWSYVFFRKKTIDSIERIGLSFALSIGIVPLIVLYTNLLGLSITIVSVITQVILVVLIALAIILFKEITKKK